MPLTPRDPDHKILPSIPQPLKWEGTLHVDLPAEARALMADLHDDRQVIGLGGMVVIALLAAAVCKYVFGKKT